MMFSLLRKPLLIALVPAYRILLLVILVACPAAAFAQDQPPTLDTTGARYDKSKSLRERFRITDAHIEAVFGLGRMAEVRESGLEQLDLAREIQSDSLIAWSYFWIGNSFSGNDLNAALRYFFLGREHALAAGDSNRQGGLDKEIGVGYKMMGHDKLAIEYLRRAQRNVTSKALVNRTAAHLSEVYLTFGKTDSALYQAQRSNVIMEPSSDPYGYARSQLVLGKAYIAKGDTEQAAVFFNRCIAVCDSFRLVMPLTQALAAQASAFFAAGNNEDAIDKGRQAYNVALQSTITLSDAIAAADIVQLAFRAIGEGDSAYTYLHRMVWLQDSLTNVNNVYKVQGMAFEQELKENETARVKAEEVATRSNNIQFAIIALIVITLGIFLLIFSRTAVVGAKAIKNLSLIALLLFFEFINLLLHPFLDRITNHSPILMLLAMAAIAGLLIPLHHRMEKLITTMLVSKNNRVRLEAARRTIEELEGAGKQPEQT